jgi:hypothetical protein
MKKYFLALLIFNAVFCFSQTSIYHPFPDSGAVWNVIRPTGCGQMSFGYNTANHSFQMQGEEIINDTVYSRIVVPQVIHRAYMCGGFETYSVPGYFAGLIRQDTLQKKVYYRYNNRDTLLYDFTLEIGDTVKSFLSNGDFFQPDVVLSIDSVLIGNSYRKRWLTNQTYQIYYIEGIGSTFGLLEPSMGGIVCPPSPQLRCFSQNSTVLYPAGIQSCSYPCNAFFYLYNEDPANQNFLAVSQNSGMPPFSYVWSWGDGTSDTTNNPSHIYQPAGQYQICVTITDSENCTSSYCDTSYFQLNPTSQMISVNVVNYRASSIESIGLEESKINLFPNPASNFLTIKTKLKQIYLSDLTGKIILILEVNNGQRILDISTIENGIYFINDGKNKGLKFIVQH